MGLRKVAVQEYGKTSRLLGVSSRVCSVSYDALAHSEEVSHTLYLWGDVYIERFHRPEGSDASGQVNLVDAVLDSKPADRTSWEAARESAQEVQLALRSQEMTPGLDKSPGPLRGVWRTRPQTPWGLPETA